MNTKPVSLPVHGLTGYALAGSRPDSKSRKPEKKGSETRTLLLPALYIQGVKMA